jgi:hypothetical protein
VDVVVEAIGRDGDHLNDLTQRDIAVAEWYPRTRCVLG